MCLSRRFPIFRYGIQLDHDLLDKNRIMDSLDCVLDKIILDHPQYA